MSAFEEDYLTVTEAAALLRMAPSTIRRWIREGELPAYRLGRRRVALRRTDLSLLISPVRTDEAQGDNDRDHGEIERIKGRKLSPEEVAQGLAAMDRAERHAKELQARRGGQPFPDSVDTIREMRAERDRQVMDAMGWDDLR